MIKQLALLERCALLLEGLRRAAVPTNIYDEYVALREATTCYLPEKAGIEEKSSG